MYVSTHIWNGEDFLFIEIRTYTDLSSLIMYICSLACQTSFHAGCFQLEIISTNAEKGLDHFTDMTGIYYH